MIKLVVTFGLAALAFAGSAYAQNSSVYTSTKTRACKTIRQSTKGAGYYVGECQGVGGYKIQLLEDDIRQSINIITPTKKKFELDFWGYFSRFSAVGEKVEWRTRKGVPVALIARLNISRSDENDKNDSYLMVSKISKTASCVTDIVDPGPKQNEKAREFADAASGKPCKALPTN